MISLFWLKHYLCNRIMSPSNYNFSPEGVKVVTFPVSLTSEVMGNSSSGQLIYFRFFHVGESTINGIS